MMRKILIVFVGLGLAACGSAPLIAGKTAPDETAVVDAPPLTLPPNFDLRPPRDGSGTGEELLQAPVPQAAEPADAWLIQKAGRADPNIRTKLAEPKPEAKVEEEPEAAPVEQQKDQDFWNIWGGWKPTDEAQ